MATFASHHTDINKQWHMGDRDFFKEKFKYLKRKCPPPELHDVIDFNAENESVVRIADNFLTLEKENHCSICEELGLRCHSTWDLYSIKNANGFIYVKNPFTESGQQVWIRKCLELYPRKPSVTNLDLHYPDVDDIWSFRNSENKEKRNYLNKLCWTTFGYHHNWDTKVYNPNHKSEFPVCLKELSRHVAFCLGFKNYEPEAAIVNYYNLKSSLGIHNDHSEEYHDAPIISYSFGQTGIFLIGTSVKTDKPSSMFLRSGDIIIMSGLCRFSYHAVPCIIQESICDKYYKTENGQDWVPFQQYITKSRINISVRQVYPQKELSF